MSSLSGLLNTRGVNDNIIEMKRPDREYIRYTQQDWDNGYRLGPSTLGLTDKNERTTIRLMNSYTFGNHKLDMIWRNAITLGTDPGTMLIRPTLLSFKVSESGILIDSKLPVKLIDDIIGAINSKAYEYKVHYLDLDHLESLKEAHIIKRPDLLLERLLSIAETRDTVTANQMRYVRMIPDSIALLITQE